MESTSEIKGGATMGAHHHQQQSRLTSVWRFIRHYLEMCLAMCVGFGVFGLVYVWAAGLVGYSDPVRQLPELSVLVTAFNMTWPMAAWMRFRGMEWRPIAEMSAAMVVEAMLLIGAGWLGILPKGGLVLWQKVFMMPIMLVPMLLRRDLYTQHHASHARRQAHAAHTGR